MSAMNTAEILRDAAAVVRRSWWQDGGTGDHCASNAIVHVSNELYCEAHRVLLLAIGADPDGLCRPIFQWNDAPDQTAENVAMTLEYAALLWEQQQAADARFTPMEEPQVVGSATQGLSS